MHIKQQMKVTYICAAKANVYFTFCRASSYIWKIERQDNNASTFRSNDVKQKAAFDGMVFTDKP